jgi:hypothetical protein
MSSPLENTHKISADKDLRGAARAWLSRANVPAGIQQWVNFHLSPISQMNPARWGNLGSVWRSFIVQSPYAHAYVDEHFRNHWNWESGTWTDLKNPLMRLAISSHQYLKQLAIFAGALVAAREIRKAVDGKTVRLLRESLGEEILHFARLQAPHLNVLIPEKCRIREWQASHAAAIVLNAGWLLIACASALLPAEEWRQFLSRLPETVEKTWNQYDFSEEDFQTAWECLQALFEVIRREK